MTISFNMVLHKYYKSRLPFMLLIWILCKFGTFSQNSQRWFFSWKSVYRVPRHPCLTDNSVYQASHCSALLKSNKVAKLLQPCVCSMVLGGKTPQILLILVNEAGENQCSIDWGLRSYWVRFWNLDFGYRTWCHPITSAFLSGHSTACCCLSFE